jgi:alanyl-tRNA synthetase
MNTTLDYLADTYLFSGEATLLEVGENEKGKYAILDKTVLYPRGGGQESDTGTIELLGDNKTIEISFV